MMDLDAVTVECVEQLVTAGLERTGFARPPDDGEHGDDDQPTGPNPLDHRRVQRRLAESLAHDEVEADGVVGEAGVEVDPPRIDPVGDAALVGAAGQCVDGDAGHVECDDVQAPRSEPQGGRPHTAGDVERSAGGRDQADEIVALGERVRRCGRGPAGVSVTLVPSASVVVHHIDHGSRRLRLAADPPVAGADVRSSRVVTEIDDTSSTQTSTSWLSAEDLEVVRANMPVVYIDAVPVRLDGLGNVVEVGMLLRQGADGAISRMVVSGRILYGERVREALMRHCEKDLGPMALPQVPPSPTPFTIAEYFPDPDRSGYFDPRQHAVSLAYVVPVSGECEPTQEALDLTWFTPEEAVSSEVVSEMTSGHDRLIRLALAHVDQLP